MSDRPDKSAGWKGPAALWLTQWIVLGIALLWGWLRGIPWWNDLQPSWLVPQCALLGALVSWCQQYLWLFPSEPALHPPPPPSRGEPARASAEALQDALARLFGELSPQSLAGLALLSGLAEEALFRGALLPELGLALSSLVFALLHGGDRRFALAVLWALVMGYGLGLLYQVSGNLAACAAFHAMSNWVAFQGLRK